MLVGRPLRVSELLAIAKAVTPEEYAEHERRYRRGYQHGFEAGMQAVLDAWFLHNKGEIEDRVGSFIDGPLYDWRHNDLEKMVFPPDFVIRCAYCGATATSVDHIVPRAQGGSDKASNRTPACQSCNSSKNARTPEEWKSGQRAYRRNRR